LHIFYLPKCYLILFCIAQGHFWNAACPALCRIFDDPGLRVSKLIRTSWAVVSLINKQFYLYLFTPFYETRPSFLRLVCRSNTFILYQTMTERTVKYHSHFRA
jgi:hypothetical protein